MVRCRTAHYTTCRYYHHVPTVSMWEQQWQACAAQGDSCGAATWLWSIDQRSTPTDVQQKLLVALQIVRWTTASTSPLRHWRRRWPGLPDEQRFWRDGRLPRHSSGAETLRFWKSRGREVESEVGNNRVVSESRLRRHAAEKDGGGYPGT